MFSPVQADDGFTLENDEIFFNATNTIIITGLTGG